MPISKAYKYTSEVMTKNAMELDAEEGISAFLEKRKPNWKNFLMKKKCESSFTFNKKASSF